MKAIEVEKMAIGLMLENGLTYPTWTFSLDEAVRRFGSCRFNREGGGMITISRRLAEINDESNVKDTILHEIAHALVCPGHGHSKTWKEKAIVLGCVAERCYDTAEVKTPEKPFIGTCPNCGRTIARHRRIKQLACGTCCRLYNHNKYSSKYKYKWTRK